MGEGVGQLELVANCQHCQHNYFSFESFKQLKLALPSSQDACYMQDLVDIFFGEKEVAGLCLGCNVYTLQNQQITLTLAPSRLCIVLDRFTIVPQPHCGVVYGKNTVKVKKYDDIVIQGNVYTVERVIVHVGEHYPIGPVVAIKKVEPNVWIKYLNSEFDVVNEKCTPDARAIQALYYQRVGSAQDSTATSTSDDPTYSL